MNNKNGLTAACISDVGRKRKLNEDSYCLDPDAGLYLVADGMGGHGAGDIASSTATQGMLYSIRLNLAGHSDSTAVEQHPDDSDEDLDHTLREQPNPMLQIISSAVEHANQEVFNLNQARGNPEGYGMGTTLVGFWRVGELNEAVLFQVGDSRLYIYRNNRLLQLTRDHTAYQEWERNGRPGSMPSQNLILRAIGLFPQVSADTRMQSLHSGDRLLICSDGLTSMVADIEVEKTLHDASNESDEYTCKQLVDMANDAGGDDNITVLLATIG